VRVFDRWRAWPPNSLNGLLSVATIDRLDEAYRFAERCHNGQTRPAGEPYVRHLLEVLEILVTELGITDPDLLAAGLLHDTVEDTDATLPDIAHRFGDRTADLVERVTMPEALPGQDRAAVRQQYLERLRHAPIATMRLKLADRYSNVQRLHTHPRVDKQRTYHAETIRYFLPMAQVDDRLATLFGVWARTYEYLDGPVDTLEAVQKLAAAVRSTESEVSLQQQPLHMTDILRGLIEETAYTLDQLRDLGVPPHIITAICGDALVNGCCIDGRRDVM
jgi:hypothetical protein